MDASDPDNPSDDTRVDDVASVVGEVSESAEQPSPSRPVTEVARSALARIRPGRAPAAPDTSPDDTVPYDTVPDDTSRGRAGRLSRLARSGSAVTRRVAGRGTSVASRAPRAAGRGLLFGGRWLASEVLTLAPRLPVRDAERLQARFPGKSPDEVAEVLIEGASRASAAVGATVGVWSVLPIAPAFPAEIVTETLTLVGIEIKLIAELHEVYGMRPPGDLASRMTAYVGAWANRRGVSLAPGGVALALGSPLARRLQRRLAARAGRSAVSLGPLLTGATAGALLNRRETRRLGQEIRDDLRKNSPGTPGWTG
jgi:hypothetical protein